MRTLERLGWTLRPNANAWVVQTDSGNQIVINKGQATGNEYEVNKLRVEYSKTVVNTVAEYAKSKNWTATKKSENKLSLKKGWF